MMKSIYPISIKYQELMRDIEMQEGILEEGQEKELIIIEETYKEQVEEYAKIVKTIGADIAFCDAEIKRITDMRLVKQGIIDRLTQIMLEALIRFGEKEMVKNKDTGKVNPIYRMQLGTFRFSTRRSESVEIDELLIEDKWKRVSISELNKEQLTQICDLLGKTDEDLKAKEDILKTPIKKAIEEGEEVKGATIVTKFGLTLK